MCSVLSTSLQLHRLQPSRLLCPWNFPGKNIRVGCHALLQGNFPTWGSDPHLLHLLNCRWILYPLIHLGSPSVCVYIETHTYIYIHIYIFLLVVILNGTSSYQTLSLTSFSNFPFSYEVQQDVKCDCPGEIKMGLFTCYHTLFSK